MSVPLFATFHEVDHDLGGGGANKVRNDHNTLNFFSNYHCTVEVFHEIAYFCLFHVVYLTNTEQNLTKLPFHCPKTCQIPNTMIIISPPPPIYRNNVTYSRLIPMTSLASTYSVMQLTWSQKFFSAKQKS